MRITVKIIRKKDGRSILWIPIDFDNLDDLKDKLLKIKEEYGDNYEIE